MPVNEASDGDKPGYPRLAYLTNYFPQVSNMFLVREVQALRAIGVPIETFTVRKPDEASATGRRMTKEHTLVNSILPLKPAVLFSALLPAIRQPRGLFDTLRWSLAQRRSTHGTLRVRLAYVIEALVLLAHCKRRNIAWIHAQFATNAADIAQLTVRLGKAWYPETDWRWSFTVHGPDELFAVDTYRLANKIADAHSVLAITQFCRSQLMMLSDPNDWEKIRIVGCGLDRSEFDQRDGEHLEITPKRRFRMIFVGRLVPAKGLPILIEAFERLSARGVDAELVVVGGAGHGAARRHVGQAKPARYAVRTCRARSCSRPNHLYWSPCSRGDTRRDSP